MKYNLLEFMNLKKLIISNYLSEKKMIQYCLLFLTLAVCIVLFGVKIYPLFKYCGRTIIIEMKTSVSATGKVYFDSGKGFNEGETGSFFIRPTTEFIEHIIPVPEKATLAIRFDPIDTIGSFAIRKIVVKTRDDSISVEKEALAHHIIPLNQIKVSGKSPFFTGDATGQDPYFTVEGLFGPTNRHVLVRTIGACAILTIAIVLVIYLITILPRCLPRPRLINDDVVGGKRLILLFSAFLFCLAVMLLIHRGAWMDYLRYSRVAEGYTSQAVQSILKGGGKALWVVARGEAKEWGRIIPAFYINYIPPYIATMARNGDLFHHDTSYPWPNRMNDDLQTHTLYLLVLLSLAGLFGMVWIYDVTGSLFAMLLLPVLVSGSLVVCENLLVNYADSQDIPQLFWVMLYIFILREMFRNNHKWLLEILSYLAMIFAYFSKETSIVLGPAIACYLAMRFRIDDPARRWLIVRQLVVHGILVIVLTSLILMFISGQYVAENLVLSHQGLRARLLFAWSSLNQGLFSPVLLCAGIGALVLYYWFLYVRKKNVTSNIASWLDILLIILLFAGFLILSLQWNVFLIKYYMVVNFFGSLGTCMLLGWACCQFRSAGKQWFSWILIVMSLFAISRTTGDVYRGIQSFYLDAYGYRKTVPLIAADIAKFVREKQSLVTPVNIVLNGLFQEGELTLLRYVNKVEHLNLIRQGAHVQNVRAIERNYFRIFPGHPSVQISATNNVYSPLNAGLVYVISRVRPFDEKDLTWQGYALEKYWDLGVGYGEVFRFKMNSMAKD